jgi:hypothetical protein
MPAELPFCSYPLATQERNSRLFCSGSLDGRGGRGKMIQKLIKDHHEISSHGSHGTYGTVFSTSVMLRIVQLLQLQRLVRKQLQRAEVRQHYQHARLQRWHWQFMDAEQLDLREHHPDSRNHKRQLVESDDPDYAGDDHLLRDR